MSGRNSSTAVTVEFRYGGVELQHVTEVEHRNYIVVAGECGRFFLLAWHVEPPLAGLGVTETFVFKTRINLNLRCNEQAFDVWLPACHACQEKFNWCSVTPIYIS